MLIEKEWLSFGHRFSLHGRQTNEKEDNFAPIFLQVTNCSLFSLIELVKSKNR